MKHKKIFPLLLVLSLLAIDCSRVPLTGRRQFTPIPVSQMQSLGESGYRQVMGQSSLSTNAQMTNQVKTVGNRIARAVDAYLKANNQGHLTENFEWEFNLIRSDQVNAWAMPGGKIAFYEGIMPICGNDDGVAVVMGHEIAHAIAQHGNERVAQGLTVELGGLGLMVALRDKPRETQQIAMAAFGLGSQLGYLLPYSRTHETEADELGIYFMAMAGYDPHEAPKFWQRMNQASSGARPPEFLSTHPAPENRIRKLEKLIPKAMQYKNTFSNL